MWQIWTSDTSAVWREGMERLSDRVGSPVLVTSRHCTGWDQLRMAWCCPYHLSHAESWNHTVQIITFKTSFSTPTPKKTQKKKGVPFFFFFWTMPCEWPLPFFSFFFFTQLLFPHMPLPQLLSHHKTHKKTCVHTHALSWGCFLQRWWDDKDGANIGS